MTYFFSGEAGVWGRCYAFNPPGGTVKLSAYGCQTTKCCQTKWAHLFCSTRRSSSLISLGCQEIRKKRIGEREGSRIQATRKSRRRTRGCISRKQSFVGLVITILFLHQWHVLLGSSKLWPLHTWSNFFFFFVPLNAESLSIDLFIRLL